MADNIKQVQWQELTEFLGRNGYGKCSGVELFRVNDAISLVPLTSRGEPARCSVLIPVEAVPRLIAELRAVAGVDQAEDSCDICGEAPATVGCPNGKQICQDCFNAGYDGDDFHDDDEFHHAE